MTRDDKKHKLATVGAEVIIKALQIKHSDCVFVPECKDGPTQSVSNFLRMDAWVMVKSWSHPRMIGYEVKVSRSDFVQDNKWPKYLPLCHEFYFATPKGLIDPDEIPKDAGLIELVGISRLIVRKKAPHRSIELPTELMTYVLMCRARIGNEIDPRLSRFEDKTIEWREWIAKRAEDRQLGYNVSRGIREYVQKVERENERLKSSIEDYKGLAAWLETMGFVEKGSQTTYRLRWDVQRKIEAFSAVFPEDLKNDLHQAFFKLAEALDAAKKYEGTIQV